MAHERYRRNLHNEDKQASLYEPTGPSKKEYVAKLTNRAYVNSIKARYAKELGLKSEVKKYNKIVNSSKSTLAKIASARSKIGR